MLSRRRFLKVPPLALAAGAVARAADAMGREPPPAPPRSLEAEVPAGAVLVLAAAFE
jgi:hypothetical protein